VTRDFDPGQSNASVNGLPSGITQMGQGISMPKDGTSNAGDVDLIAHAWIEALEEDHIFIGTAGSIAGFRRQQLPPRWSDHYRAPEGNLALARKIDCHGSPAETPLDQVNRLDWPLA
jgi:hypothetical protein